MLSITQTSPRTLLIGTDAERTSMTFPEIAALPLGTHFHLIDSIPTVIIFELVGPANVGSDAAYTATDAARNWVQISL